MAIEAAMNVHKRRMTIDLEGNLVFQEVMNCITHGLGVLLAFMGSTTLSSAVRGSSTRHVVSCAVYSTSLVVLYTSSTLYHSFFSMRNTKWVFEVLDKCAIYILISGSYTPFLQIVLSHKPIWSIYLLGFLWLLCFLGITVEFTMPTWEYKGIFSLAMYLGMGWSGVVCLPGKFDRHKLACLTIQYRGCKGATIGGDELDVPRGRVVYRWSSVLC
jgi:channel protein (hemolysin III family)